MCSVFALNARKNVDEVVGGLVVLAFLDDFRAFRYVFGRARGEQHPALNAADEGVPSRCAERVDMHTGATALRAHEKPAVRRPPSLAYQPVSQSAVSQHHVTLCMV